MGNIPGFSNVSRGYLDFHAFSPVKDSDKELFCLPLGTLERLLLCAKNEKSLHEK